MLSRRPFYGLKRNLTFRERHLNGPIFPTKAFFFEAAYRIYLTTPSGSYLDRTKMLTLP